MTVKEVGEYNCTQMKILQSWFIIVYCINPCPLPPTSDQERISPFNINTISSIEKCQLELLVDLISNFQIDVIRIVCQRVKRITNEVVGVNGLKMEYIHCMSTAWGVSYTNFVEENTKSNSYRDHEDQENVFWNNAETGQNTNIHLQLNFCPTTENFLSDREKLSAILLISVTSRWNFPQKKNVALVRM